MVILFIVSKIIKLIEIHKFKLHKVLCETSKTKQNTNKLHGLVRKRNNRSDWDILKLEFLTNNLPITHYCKL